MTRPSPAALAGRASFGLVLLTLLLLGFAFAFLAVPGPLPACADEPVVTEEEEERLEAIERHTERGWKAFLAGNHDETLARMARIEKYDPENPLPDYLRTRVDLRRGAYDDARKRAEAACAEHPHHRGLEAALYEVLRATGAMDEMLAAADARLARNPKDAMAHVARGLALEERGHREEALEAHEAAIATYERATSPVEEIPWIARAAIRATWLSPDPADDLLGEAGKLMGRYMDAHPDDQDVLLMYADLFQSQRSSKAQATASKHYRNLLKANSEIAEARVGLARKVLLFYQQDRAVMELERALATNPNLTSALSLLAAIHVGNGDYEKADELLGRALKVNPVHAEARAVKAARLWITGRRDDYYALEIEVRAWNPMDARFYVVISDLVGERQRRYDVAEQFAAKAIEIDPNDPLGYTVHAEALMNLGRTDEARAQFEIAVDKSKRYSDVKRDNWLQVLDVIEDFRSVTTEHFVIRMHPSESAVLSRYLPDLLEDSWDVLNAKYGDTPTSPVLVDAFHIDKDFSVRSVGVPGLPALGVCFGRVITLLGPTSKPVGAFSWASTTWHEYAHVVTLHQSEGQVPRWLTEGLSTYEETARNPSWGRNMERQLFNRYHNDRLLRMDKINSAFRGPDIVFGYYQGGLIVEHLTKTRGFGVIPEMLKAFAKDRTTAQVFEDVLGLDLADYDAQFKAFVGKMVGDFQMVPRWDAKSREAFEARVKADASDGRAWLRLGWAHLQAGREIDAGAALSEALLLVPDDPDVILLSGRLAEVNDRADLAFKAYTRFLATGRDDLRVRLFLASRLISKGEDTEAAIPHLEAAKACFPLYVGKDSPYRVLAKLYKGAGQLEKAVKEMEAYAQIAGEDYSVRKELKDWYIRRKDHESVVRICGEMVEINPFGAARGKTPDLELHRDYAEALMTLDRMEDAQRELEVQVAILGLLPEEKRVEAKAVETRVTLGELYLDADRPLDALEQAIAALRLSPTDAKARMLKARAEEAAGYR